MGDRRHLKLKNGTLPRAEEGVAPAALGFGERGTIEKQGATVEMLRRGASG